MEGATGTTALVERAVTALEQLVLRGRTVHIPRWTAILWNHRSTTRQILLARLQSGSARAPELLLEILAGLGGSRVPSWMRRLAANTALPDAVRIEARRRAGWPARSERRARAAFLRTLDNPGIAIARLVAAGAAVPVPDAEALEDATGYLLALPPDVRVPVVGGLLEEMGEGIIWLLRALLSAGDAETAGFALNALLRARDRGASAGLERLRRAGPDQGLRVDAAVAVRRLSLHALAGGAAPARRRPSGSRRGAPDPAPAFERAALTAVDGRGGQAVTVVRAWDAEAALVLQVFLRDEEGVVSIRGAMRVPREETREMLRLVGRPDCPVVEVSLDEARQAVLWAVNAHLERGRQPPATFALWEPFLFADLCPEPEPAPVPALALAGGRAKPSCAGVRDLAHSPFCESWRFGADQLAPVLADLPVDAGGSDRYGDMLTSLCDRDVRLRLGRRLRRQAWVLDRSGRADLRDAALGCATGLETGESGDVSAEPLLRTMLARGLGGLRESRRRRR